jgi:hypothetical protein
MKKLILLSMVCLMGCAPVRQSIEGLSAEHLKNTKTAEKLGGILLDCWDVWGGMFEKCGIDSIDAANDIEELFTLSEIPPEERTPRDKGGAIILWCRIYKAATGKAIEDISELAGILAVFL